MTAVGYLEQPGLGRKGEGGAPAPISQCLQRRLHFVSRNRIDAVPFLTGDAVGFRPAGRSPAALTGGLNKFT